MMALLADIHEDPSTRSAPQRLVTLRRTGSSAKCRRDSDKRVEIMRDLARQGRFPVEQV